MHWDVFVCIKVNSDASRGGWELLENFGNVWTFQTSLLFWAFLDVFWLRGLTIAVEIHSKVEGLITCGANYLEPLLTSQWKLSHYVKKRKTKYLLRAIPTLFLFFRAKRGENLLWDSNTRTFCAEDAERFFSKFNPEMAKKSLLICKIGFFFTKLQKFRLRAKFVKNCAEEFTLGARPAG